MKRGLSAVENSRASLRAMFTVTLYGRAGEHLRHHQAKDVSVDHRQPPQVPVADVASQEAVTLGLALRCFIKKLARALDGWVAFAALADELIDQVCNPVALHIKAAEPLQGESGCSVPLRQGTPFSPRGEAVEE